MKIRDRYTREVAAPGGARTREKPPEAVEAARGGGGPADRVQISDRGVEVRRAHWLAVHAPEVRVELVDEIVGLIGRGEYRVTGAQVAPRLIRDHLMEQG